MKLADAITIAGATLTKQEYDGADERPMYCDNESAVWLGKAKHGDEPLWQADFVIGAAHFVVVDAESLGDVLVQLGEQIDKTRAAFARLATPAALARQVEARVLREAAAVCYDRAEREGVDLDGTTSHDSMIRGQACSGCGHALRAIADEKERAR